MKTPRMVKDLRGWFVGRWAKLRPKSTALEGEDSKDLMLGSEPARIFIAPTGDGLMDSMSGWLLSVASGLNDIRAILTGDLASTDQFKATIKRHSGSPLLVVFYGHGCFEAFLTTSSLGFDGHLHEDVGLAHLCVAADFPSDANLLVVGFCCSAGSQLAAELAARSSCSFLGFDDEIGFIVDTPEQSDSFRAPMHAAVEDVVRSGFADELVLHSLKQAYRTERRRWLPGGDRDQDPDALLVAMLLDEQRKLVRLKV